MKDKKKRIAVIGLKGLPAFGGAAAVGENIIEQLKEKYDFTVYSVSSHTSLKSGNYNGYKQVVLKAIPLKKINTLFYYFRVFFMVLFTPYDIVHLHHSDMALLIPLLRIRHKVVVTTHGAHNVGVTEKWRRYKWFFRGQLRLLRCADSLNCVSKQEVRWLKEQYNVEGNYIPNGINIPQKLQDHKQNYILFASGRIIPDKGCHTLIKALVRMEFKGKLLVAGDISQMKEYTEELKVMSKTIDIDFLGMVKEKQKLLQFIKSACLFVYPSEKEAMSMMLLEAASTGTPIVCSDIVENRDVFSDEDVYFFNNKSVEDLSIKLKYLLSHLDEINSKSIHAISTLNKNHNWHLIAQSYDKIYQHLML